LTRAILTVAPGNEDNTRVHAEAKAYNKAQAPADRRICDLLTAQIDAAW
jgi:hypothetical protein